MMTNITETNFKFINLLTPQTPLDAPSEQVKSSGVRQSKTLLSGVNELNQIHTYLIILFFEERAKIGVPRKKPLSAE